MNSEQTPPAGPGNQVNGSDMAEWCDWLRDDNAIHLSREAAEAAGFGPRRVNPGPANLAHALSAVMAADPQAEFAEITAIFTANVFEGDHLTVTQTRSGNTGTASLYADGNPQPVLQAGFTLKKDA